MIKTTGEQEANAMRTYALMLEGEGYFNAAYYMRSQADKIDPPRPRPGTLVRWRFNSEEKWENGVVYGRLGSVGADGILDSTGTRRRFDKVEWKPARILAPGQVALLFDEARAARDHISTVYDIYHVIDRKIEQAAREVPG